MKRIIVAGAGACVLAFVVWRIARGSGDTDEAAIATLTSASMLADAASNEPIAAAPSCIGVSSAADVAPFSACVAADLDRYWRDAFARESKPWDPPKLVVVAAARETDCGTASVATGSFYCSIDGTIYLESGFFQELGAHFRGHGGDLAAGYVIAHLVGHHVEHLLGADAALHEPKATRNMDEDDIVQALELEADCYAGMWAKSSYDATALGEPRIEGAMKATNLLGTTRVDLLTADRVRPESFAYAPLATREHWIETGMQSAGNRHACDTFADINVRRPHAH